jgi:hypothetical protein
LRWDHRYRTQAEKSGAGPISAIPVVEVISVVIPAADRFQQRTKSMGEAFCGAIRARNAKGQAESAGWRTQLG